MSNECNHHAEFDPGIRKWSNSDRFSRRHGMRRCRRRVASVDPVRCRPIRPNTMEWQYRRPIFDMLRGSLGSYAGWNMARRCMGIAKVATLVRYSMTWLQIRAREDSNRYQIGPSSQSILMWEADCLRITRGLGRMWVVQSPPFDNLSCDDNK